MIYADYGYYLNIYLGSVIAEDDFPGMAARSSRYIDYITQGRAAPSGLDAVKLCCCALAEQYQIIESAKKLAVQSLECGIGDGAEVQSETVGSWSRSYRAGGSSAAAALEAAEKAGDSALYQTAQRYLAHTGLLYRGGGRKCSL